MVDEMFDRWEEEELTRSTTQLCFDCNEHKEQRKRFNGDVIFCNFTESSAGNSMTRASA